mgnify:CR=1 FL=1|tara:strand:+ start:20422 stop:20547 length:126 start_codon:yes stop_codon:yes gene_type:complete
MEEKNKSTPGHGLFLFVVLSTIIGTILVVTTYLYLKCKGLM